jgi:6-phosphogluconolactonase
MRNRSAALCALAIVLSGWQSGRAAGAIARTTPFALLVPYFTVVGDIWSSKGISVYKVDATTGKLRLVAGSPFVAGTNPVASAITPNGRFAYVVNKDSRSVSAYKVNASTGALTATRSFGLTDWSSDPSGIAIDPEGRHAYVVSNAGVSAFSIDAETGSLTPIPGSPFASVGGEAFGTASIAVDPSGRFAYVLNYFHNAVYAYAIDATGALKPAASPLPAGQKSNEPGESSTVTIDPKGKFAYVTAGCCLYVYAIDARTGALTPSAHLGLGEAGDFSLKAFTIDPTGRFAYALNGGRIYAYAIDATNGRLKALRGRKYATDAGGDPYLATIEPTGMFAYVYDRGEHGTVSAIYGYRIGPATGELTPLARSPLAVAGSTIDPIAHWFNTGRCAAFSDEFLSGAPELPHVKGNSEDLIFGHVTDHVTTTSRYLYDRAGRIALHYPTGDSGVIVTLRVSSGDPPPGVPRVDLSNIQTTSGIRLGSSAETVVRRLGKPKIVAGCNQQRYLYARDLMGNLLEFTIRRGHVTEISEDLGG